MGDWRLSVNRRIKAWGWSEQKVEAGCLTVFKIEIFAGGYCSKHIHQRKSNGFIVEQGKMRVSVWDGNGVSSDVILTPTSGCFIVPPNVPHRFNSDVGCEAFEIYFKQEGEEEPLSEDIIRYSIGGLWK